MHDRVWIGGVRGQRDGLAAAAPLFVMGGKNLYAPLTASLVLELINDGLICEKVAQLSSMPMSGGKTHQLALDEYQEELQRRFKALYALTRCRIGRVPHIRANRTNPRSHRPLMRRIRSHDSG